MSNRTRQVSRVLAVMVGWLALAAARPARADDDRVKMAAEIYQKVVSDWRPSEIEPRYLWSRRWLDAQREASPAAKDVVVALTAHLERMRAMETETHKFVAAQMVSPAVETQTRFFRVEAEAWLAAATGKKPAPAARPAALPAGKKPVAPVHKP